MIGLMLGVDVIPRLGAQIVQYVTVSTVAYQSVNIPVQTNQIISIAGYDGTNQLFFPIYGCLANGTTIGFNPFLSGVLPQVATGLTNISVTGRCDTCTNWATFQIITPASAVVVSNYVPADAIVIPASTTGNVQVILESSPDLVNWTAASPGTYGPSAATNRFFRVRATAN